MAAKGVETMLKTSEMTLKTAQNRVSFGLNGSHKARKRLQGKGARFCPPPDTSKISSSKELGPIITARGCQNGRNRLTQRQLWISTFSKK